MSLRPTCCAFFVLSAALVSIAGFLEGLAAEEPTRTWTDASDRYRIEARLIGHEGGTVRLKKADDSVIEIPLDQLSEGDREYVAKYDAGNPFLRGMKKSEPGAAPAMPMPAPVSPASIEPAPQATKPAPTDDEGKPSTVDWASVPSIDSPLSLEMTSLPIVPAEQGPALTERTIGLPDLREFSENAGAVVVDGPTGTAAFSASSSRGNEASTLLTTIDLASGRVTSASETSGSYRLLAWDPLAKRALMASANRDPRVKRTVEIWSLAGDGLTKELVVNPSGDSIGIGREVEWGCFLDDERFALLAERGRFSVWSIESRDPIATTPIGEYREAAVSADRAFVALGGIDSVTFVDMAELKIVGRLKGSIVGLGSIAFSPDGKRFAAETVDKIRVWDTSDFSKIVDLKGGRGRGAFFFADEGRIYVYDRLIDVESGREIVQISNATEVVDAGGGFCWLYAEDRGSSVRKLVALPALPEDAVGELEILPPEPRQVLFAAGTPVCLDLTAIEDEAMRNAAQRSLEEVVKKSGRSIEENAAASLVATIEKGKEQTFQYTKVERRGFGPGPPFGPFIGPRIGPFGDDIKERRELKIVPVTLKLELRSEDRSVWSQSRSQLPGQLQNLPPVPSFSISFPIPEGKTVDDVVKDIQTPNPDRFGEFELPAEILAPEILPPPLLGSRRLTIGGLQ